MLNFQIKMFVILNLVFMSFISHSSSHLIQFAKAFVVLYIINYYHKYLGNSLLRSPSNSCESHQISENVQLYDFDLFTHLPVK